MHRRQLIQNLFYSSLVPSWSPFFSTPINQSFRPLHIEGTLPTDLEGTLFRVGPFTFASPDGEKFGHWFDGDGGIVAVQFADGKALGALQMIQTPYLTKEQKKQKRIYFGYDSPAPHAAMKFLTGQFKNLANTNIVPFPTEEEMPALYALVESSLPTKIDPQTLNYIKEEDFDCIKGGFSAHPRKLATRPKEIWNIGIQFGRENILSLYHMTSSQPKRFVIGKPHSPIVHDFVLCDKYAIIIEPPLRLDIVDVIKNKGAFASSVYWEEERGTKITFVDLTDPMGMKRSFLVSAFYQWHFANAYRDGENIVIDLVYYKNFDSSAALANIPTGQKNQGQLNGVLRRCVLNEHHEQIDWFDIGVHSGEFPQIHPSCAGQKHRFVYLAEHSTQQISRQGLPDTISQYDLENDIRKSCLIGEDILVGEPVVTSKGNVVGDFDEEKVWILVQFMDVPKSKGGIAIIDGEQIEVGPIAKCYFDVPIPPTFHGTFVN